jgi:hypothetical protein
MFTTEQYLNAIRHEVAVVKHLYSKVPKDKLSYRPSPGQRSLQELIDFLPCNLTVIKLLASGEWASAEKIMKEVREAAAKDFTGTMDRELVAFVKVVNATPVADFANKDVTLPTGAKTKLGDALLNFPLKFISAYKMQLFLYLKACGKTELNTLNAWFGVDGQMGHPPR